MPRKSASTRPVTLAPELDEEFAVEPAEFDFNDLLSLDEQDDYLNALWYGDNGTGKTSDVCTMANLGPTIVVNAESGLKKRPLQRLGVNTSNLLVFPNVKAGQLLTFDTLEELYWKLKGQLERDPGSVAGVIWDSLTDIHKKLLENITTHQVEKAAAAGRDRDRFFVDRSDWGVMSEQVRLLCRRFRDLPCHFAITALERRDVDDDGEVRYGPAVTPALQSDVLGYVDVVCHTRAIEIDGVPQYRALTAKGTKFAAKDRYGVLPAQMINPTFERVYNYAITGELEVETDDVQAAGRAAVENTKIRKAIDETEASTQSE